MELIIFFVEIGFTLWHNIKHYSINAINAQEGIKTMSKTMMSAPLSQEQMESLVKEYCFKLWKEKDLPVLENLILSCGGKYKLFFIKGYLSLIKRQIVVSRDDILLTLGEDKSAKEECRIEQQKYKQMLTHVVELLADDKTGVGKYLENKHPFSETLNEIMECLRNMPFEDWSVFIDSEEITYDDFWGAIQLHVRFDYSFDYQTRKEFLDLIKFAKIRNILKTLSDQEKQKHFIDCFVLDLLVSKNKLEEINPLMASLKSKNEVEYQDAINTLKKDLNRLAKGKSFANEEEKNSYINGTKYRFLISYILSNRQEDAWFNNYANLVFQTKEDLEFLEEYGHVFNSLGWADKLSVMLSDNLKQNWVGVLMLQLNSLKSVTRREKYSSFKDGLSEDDDEEVQYSLINVTESDKVKLLSLIDTSAPVEELQKALRTIRKDGGYTNFVNTLTFPQGKEYKRLILEGEAKTPDELLQIVESLNFDDIEHIFDNLFMSLSRENVMALADGIGKSLDHLKEVLDKKGKESISEIDEEMTLDDLRTLEEVCFVLCNKLVSSFYNVSQKLEVWWFKRWLMGRTYRKQLNEFNNRLTAFTVTLPSKIVGRVFISQNYNSHPK